jgi:hypothetical protein
MYINIPNFETVKVQVASGIIDVVSEFIIIDTWTQD